MRHLLMAGALLLGACDSASDEDPDNSDPADGTRGPCTGGGQIFGEDACGPVETSEDACWKLVQCGAISLDRADSDDGALDWGSCVDEIDRSDGATQEVVIRCVALASCEELATNNPYERPDCLEYR